MSRDTFAGFHPVVNLLYFALVIGFSMFFLHPVSLLVSLSSASAYAVYLNGKKAAEIRMDIDWRLHSISA